MFYNDYRDLASNGSFETEFVFEPPFHVLATGSITNKGEVRTRGLELAVNAAPWDWSRLQFTYALLHVDEVANISGMEGGSPEHQLGLLCSMDLPHDLELDIRARYVDDLPALDIDGYATLDVRLGWRPSENLEFSLVGQNLLDDAHPEYRDPFLAPISTEVEPGVYGKVTWRF